MLNQIKEKIMVSLTINNVKVEVPEGTTILGASLRAGYNIPTLCHLESQLPKGACRVCMVEVEGAKSLIAACAAPVAEGMKVHTNTKAVRDARKFVVELLISEHCGDCKTC